MQNLSESEIEKIKALHKRLWNSDLFNLDIENIKGAKIHYEEWVQLVFLISSGKVNAFFGEGHTNPKPFVLSLNCPSEGGLAVIHPDHMPDRFKNDIEKIKYVFQKLDANSKLAK